MTEAGTLTLPRLLAHQRGVLLDPARFKVLVCGRRWGKTTAGLVAVLEGHGPDRALRGALQGANVWWVARSYPDSLILWRALQISVRGAVPTLAVSQEGRRVAFPGGGAVTVRSAHDPDSLRGAGLDGLVLDEAAFVAGEAWTLALRPALADRGGWALLLSTPNGVNWFEEAFRRGLAREPGWAAWQRPTADNPRVPAAEIAEMRASMAALRFAQEIEARFVSLAGGGLFRREALARYATAPGGLVSFASADLAVSTRSWADWTAVARWGAAPDGTLYLLEVVRERVDGGSLAGWLATIVARWGARSLVLEAGGPLAVVNAQLRAAGVPVLEIGHGGRDKVSRAHPLAQALESGRARLPEAALWLDELVAELCAFPSPGAHDDQVDALALGVLACPPAAPQRAHVEDLGETSWRGWDYGLR